VERCELTRAVVGHVDWDCEVLTNYSESNLGCKRRVSSGIDWVFESVEEAIILEDDCLPDQSFFRYCEELLEKYRHDERVAQISGVNYQKSPPRSECSYYYSRYNHIWGWASWRRAWKSYDVNMTLWPRARDERWLEDMFADAEQVRKWRRIFQAVADGKIDTWDYQWTFACWMNSALTILPRTNLVSNIGFGAEATHTTGASKLSELTTHELQFPLRHSPFVIRDARADAFTEKFEREPMARRILNRLDWARM